MLLEVCAEMFDIVSAFSSKEISCEYVQYAFFGSSIASGIMYRLMQKV